MAVLFDAHTHLNFEKYTDEERAGLAAEIEASEVGYIVDAADCVASARQALADAAAHAWCYAAVGMHPDHASALRAARLEKGDSHMLALLESELDEIERLAASPKAVAIGEIGLDYHYGIEDREEQQELFRRQIRLANRLGLPIMIHSRDAHRLTMDILIEEGAFSEERKSRFEGRPSTGMLLPGAKRSDISMPGEYESEDGMRLAADARVQLHCFSGSPELAEEYVRLGATISLGGPITFKNGKKAAEVAARIPIEFLMSETDAPYMAPEPLRGKPNKSPYIEHIVRRMAMLKGAGYEETADVLTKNAKRFFGIDD